MRKLVLVIMLMVQSMQYMVASDTVKGLFCCGVPVCCKLFCCKIPCCKIVPLCSKNCGVPECCCCTSCAWCKAYAIKQQAKFDPTVQALVQPRMVYDLLVQKAVLKPQKSDDFKNESSKNPLSDDIRHALAQASREAAKKNSKERRETANARAQASIALALAPVLSPLGSPVSARKAPPASPPSLQDFQSPRGSTFVSAVHRSGPLSPTENTLNS